MGGIPTNAIISRNVELLLYISPVQMARLQCCMRAIPGFVNFCGLFLNGYANILLVVFSCNSVGNVSREQWRLLSTPKACFLLALKIFYLWVSVDTALTRKR